MCPTESVVEMGQDGVTKLALTGSGLIVAAGLVPLAFNLLTGKGFTQGQRAKWEARLGGEVPPSRIRVMRAGGTLVLVGILLTVWAIVGISNAAVVAPIGLVLVAAGALTSIWARRWRPA